MIVRCETADDVSAIGSAVSGVFDGVGLVSSAIILTTLVRLTRSLNNGSRRKLTSMIASPFAFSSIVGAGSFGGFAEGGLANG